MIGHEPFEPGNFVLQDGATLRGASAASRAGFRAARCITAEGPTVGPVAGPGLGTPGD
jgi:hypothetical protein